MLLIYGWQGSILLHFVTFSLILIVVHRIMSVEGIEKEFGWEIVHMVSSSIWGIYMFLGFGLTVDNVQLLRALWIKKVRGLTPDAELHTPIYQGRTTDDDVEYFHSPVHLSWKSSDDSPLLDTSYASSAGGSFASKSYAGKATSFSYSGTGLSGYLTKPSHTDTED